MQVFKLLFHLLKENKVTIFIYFMVTFLCAVVFVKTQTMSLSSQSEATPDIAIFSQCDGEYAKGLIAYLDAKCTINDIREDQVEDAMFYHQINYILYLDENFDEQLEKQQTLDLKVKRVNDSASSYLAAQYVSDYVATLQNNIAYGKQVDKAAIVKQTLEDLDHDIATSLKNTTYKEEINFYFNMLGYTFYSCMIGCVGYAMIVMNQIGIRRRTIVSPMKNLNMNLQLLFGYIVFALFLGVVAWGLGWLLFPVGMQESFAPYMVLNLFVSLVPSLGMAYLFGTIIHSLELLSGLSNVFCLVMAFLGGTFVQQSLLSDAILKVGSFTPNYWFVKANDALYQIQSFQWENLQPIFSYMGIQILFGVVFVLIAMLYSKQKRKNVV